MTKIFGAFRSRDRTNAIITNKTLNYGLPAWEKILNGTTLTVGCNNVFGHDPPDAATFTNYADFAYDATGRFVYVSLTKKF